MADGASRRAPEHRPRRRRPAPVSAGVELEAGREYLAAPHEDDSGRLDERAAPVGEKQRARLPGLAVEKAQPGVAPPARGSEQDPPFVDHVRPAVRGLVVFPIDDGKGDRLAAVRPYLLKTGVTRAAEDDPAVRVPRPAGRFAVQAADGGRPVLPALAGLRISRASVACFVLSVPSVSAQRHRPEPTVREEPHRCAVRCEEGLPRALRAGHRLRLEPIQTAHVQAASSVRDCRVGKAARVGRDRDVQQFAVRWNRDRQGPPGRRDRRRRGTARGREPGEGRAGQAGQRHENENSAAGHRSQGS